jgi:predicted SAM-dependent methyltransferase
MAGLARKIIAAAGRVGRECGAPLRLMSGELRLQRDIRHCKKLLADYLASPGEKRIHLGCGKNRFSGWFNTDILQDFPDVGYVDAMRPFKMPGDIFDFAFSEHMIEHLPWTAGQNMLGELHRVLKPRGVLRIATPDLRQILKLGQTPPDETQQQYIAWSRDRYTKHIVGNDAAIVINNFFHSWGHAFIYDFDCMKAAMERVGFVDVQRRSVGQSPHATLANLERHADSLGGSDLSNLYETMVVEATKR